MFTICLHVLLRLSCLIAAFLCPQVSQGTLERRLAEYVERIDTDMALEYQVSQGLAAGAAKNNVWLVPASSRHTYGVELHSSACVVKLIQHYG